MQLYVIYYFSICIYYLYMYNGANKHIIRLFASNWSNISYMFGMQELPIL